MPSVDALMLAELVHLAHDSPNARSFEGSVLQLVQQQIGCEALFFLVRGQEQDFSSIGLSPELRQLARTRGDTYARELLPVKRAALAARGVAVDTDVLGTARVQQMAYYREMAASVGGQHSLMAYVPFRHETVAALMLGRTSRRFSAAEVRAMEQLLPSMGLARAAFGLPTGLGPAPKPLPDAPPSVSSWPRFLTRKNQSFELEARTIATGTLRVRDRAGYREMVAESEQGTLVWTRSDLRDQRVSGWPYIDLFHVAAALASQRRRALFIGCGGGVAAQQFASTYPGICLDVVDNEPVVFELAQRWFNLQRIPGLSTHVSGGAEFVRRAKARSFDVVVVDTYDASTFSKEFMSRRFLSDLTRALCEGGSVAFNVISTLTAKSPASKLHGRLIKMFDDVRLLPVIRPGEPALMDQRNVVLVARSAKT